MEYGDGGVLSRPLQTILDRPINLLKLMLYLQSVFRYIVLTVCLLFDVSISDRCQAQPTDLRRTYDRSTQLVQSDNSGEMLLFLDSLEHRTTRSEEDRILYDLMRARWYRHSGSKLEAHHIFDSVE